MPEKQRQEAFKDLGLKVKPAEHFTVDQPITYCSNVIPTVDAALHGSTAYITRVVAAIASFVSKPYSLFTHDSFRSLLTILEPYRFVIDPDSPTVKYEPVVGKPGLTFPELINILKPEYLPAEFVPAKSESVSCEKAKSPADKEDQSLVPQPESTDSVRSQKQSHDASQKETATKPKAKKAAGKKAKRAGANTNRLVTGTECP